MSNQPKTGDSERREKEPVHSYSRPSRSFGGPCLAHSLLTSFPRFVFRSLYTSHPPARARSLRARGPSLRAVRRMGVGCLVTHFVASIRLSTPSILRASPYGRERQEE